MRYILELLRYDAPAVGQFLREQILHFSAACLSVIGLYGMTEGVVESQIAVDMKIAQSSRRTFAGVIGHIDDAVSTRFARCITHGFVIPESWVLSFRQSFAPRIPKLSAPETPEERFRRDDSTICRKLLVTEKRRLAKMRIAWLRS